MKSCSTQAQPSCGDYGALLFVVVAYVLVDILARRGSDIILFCFVISWGVVAVVAVLPCYMLALCPNCNMALPTRLEKHAAYYETGDSDSLPMCQRPASS